jgi:1,4-alpha-glucan branching enzyme
MAGQTYRYWLQNGTHVLQRPDARSRQVSDQESVIVDPTAFAWKTAAFTPPRREESVVYELHVAGYAGKGDANAGTFAGVVDRLDHLVTLGVNVIELMPVNHFSGRGWGYNPLGYYAPNPDYGAPDDLRRLVDEAHQRGIAVWLDVVYNHYDGWTGAPLYCYDGTCPGNSGVYFFAGAPYGSTPWGPRPDYSSPDVAGFILDSVTSWLTEYRVDGFRWDSTSNIRALDGSGEVPGGRSLLQDANDLIHATPNALSIAEDLKGYGDMTLPVDQGGFGFDAQWDGFGWTIDGAVVGSSDAARDVAGVRDAIKGTYNGDPFQRLLFTDNHDVDGNGSVRLAQKIDPTDPGSWAARKRTLLAAGVLLTTPGVPMLFMGQEFLERGGFTDPPKALDWTKEQSYGPVQQAYVDLIRLRRNLDGVSAGLTCPNVDIIQFNDTAKVLAYRRSCADGGEVVAVANFGIKSYPRYDVGLPSGGSWHVRVNTDDLKYSTDFGGASSADVTALAKSYDGLPFTGPIVLGPYSIVVLSK